MNLKNEPLTPSPSKLSLALLIIVLALVLLNVGAWAADDGKVTVTFSPGIYEGFSYVQAPAPQTFTAGGTATQPGEDELKIGVVPYCLDGYDFDGWYVDKTCTELFDFSTPITEDITLYAGFILGEAEQRFFSKDRFGGIDFTFGTTPECYERFLNDDLKVYYSRCSFWAAEWFEDMHIRDFSMIDGLDYDSVNHVLTFNNYNGPAISIKNYSQTESKWTDIDDMEIRFEGTNNIYTSYTDERIALEKLKITFTGNGTVNLDYPGFRFTKPNEPNFYSLHQWGTSLNSPYENNQFIWDGPTLNIMGMMGMGINQNIPYTNYLNNLPHFKMLSGAINIDYIPVTQYKNTDKTSVWDPIVCLGHYFDLRGGSLYVHYRKANENDKTNADIYKFLYGIELSGAQYATGTWPVLEGAYGYYRDRERMEREPYISPDFDFTIEVDDDLRELGFDAVPFVLEDYDFSFLQPDLTEEAHNSSTYNDWYKFVGTPVTDFSGIEGLSYDFDQYKGLPDDTPHTLVMENYSGPGLRIRSMNYTDTPLTIEVKGDNTIYCNGLCGLWLEDVDVTFTGDGTLRFVSADPQYEGTFTYTDSTDSYVPVYSRTYSGILSYVGDDNVYTAQQPAEITVDGANIIFEGYYRYGGIADMENVTVKSGSLAMTSAHQPMKSTEIREHSDRSQSAYQNALTFGRNWFNVQSTLELSGGCMVVNYDASPIDMETFYADPQPGEGLRLLTMKADSDFTVSGGTLLLAGEERVLSCTPYITKVNDDNSKTYAQYTGAVRKVQTAAAEKGRALVRVEAGQVIVTAEPEAKYELQSLSYVVGSGVAVSLLDLDGDGKYIFPLPEGTDDVTITPVFGLRQMSVTAEDVNVSYDGLSHGITVVTDDSAIGTAIMYGTVDGTYNMSESPTITDVGSLTVYYRITSDNFADYTGSATVTIGKKALTVTAKNFSITYGDTPSGKGVTYSGFVNDETESVLSGTLSYTYDYIQYGDAGNDYTITPGGLTSSNYDISFVPGTLTVEKKTIGLTWDTATALIFNGNAQAPSATATGMVNNDAVTVVVSGARSNAGTGYTAIASGLTGDKAYNYKLPETGLSQEFSIGKAASQTIPAVSLNRSKDATGIAASVAGLMPSNAGTVSYTKGAETHTGNVSVSGFTVNSDGTVKAAISGGVTGDTITLPVTISSTNYNDSTVDVIITLIDKSDAGVSITGTGVSGGAITKTYGDEAFTLTGEVADAGDGTGVWTWTSNNTAVADVDDTGAVTIIGGGTATITAAYESDTAFGQAVLALTVNPKSVAIPAAAGALKWTGSEQTGVASGDGYTVTNGKATDVGNYTATISLNSITDYQWSDGTSEAKDIQWSIGRADGPAAPTGLSGIAPTTEGGSDGKITGVTDAMEYSTDTGFGTKTACVGTTVTGLAAGIYYVRVKETETHQAGAYATVTVPAFTPDPTPSPVHPTKTVEVKATATYKGEKISVSANMSLFSEIDYTGSKLKPSDIGYILDLSDLYDDVTIRKGSYKPEDLFKISYVNRNNLHKSTSKKKGTIYAKLGLNEKKAKKAGLTKTEIGKLKAIVKALNKQFKKNPCVYTVKAVKLDAENATITADITWTKKGKIKKVKSIKVTTVINGEQKTIKLKSGQYKVEVKNAMEKTVTITGKGDFEGTVTVISWGRG